jgi:hypothetical protein
MTGNHVFETLADAGIVCKADRPGTSRLPCPECAKGKGDGALAVTLKGDGTAVWFCHRCGFKGAVPTRPMPGQAQAQRKPALRLRAPPASAPRSPSSAMSALLRQCRPISTDSPQPRYLRGRGCAMPQNDVLAHPGLLHRPSGRTFPALVSIVTNVLTAEPQTLHLTYLAPDGSGKAPVDRPRLLLPGLPKAGGVIRLVDDAEVTMGLAIAEGLETALAAARFFPAIWATIDAGNLAALPVLDGIECLTIFADHDRPNPKTGKRAGTTAAEACARRWADAGREVRVFLPPREGEDIADLAVGDAG